MKILKIKNINKRLVPNIIILIVLSSQIVIPLSYYLGNQNKFDERFSWRMFSPVRMVRCHTVWREGKDRHKVNPQTYIHIVWVNLMNRLREDVIQHYISSRCQALSTHTKIPYLYAKTVCTTPITESVQISHDEIATHHRISGDNHFGHDMINKRFQKQIKEIRTPVYFEGQKDIHQNLCTMVEL
jgi:hypothetical protein